MYVLFLATNKNNIKIKNLFIHLLTKKETIYMCTYFNQREPFPKCFKPNHIKTTLLKISHT